MVKKSRKLVLSPIIFILLFFIHFIHSYEERVGATFEKTNTLGISSIYSVKQAVNQDAFDLFIKKEFSDIALKIGDRKKSILAMYGKPNEVGSYEGGFFYDYDKVTFIVNPETDIIVAIVKKLQESDLLRTNVIDQLGEPDNEELDPMDGFWTIRYHKKDLQLIFESETKNNAIRYIWMRRLL
ncbi:hypothetical protein BKP45_15655 [Anaerobacillus alkalidiazotrophicus]|uniref:DUF4309 domain-containing protein n=1 Tax=Anaerobacillus alkalidiazotrophicus TaxID=472963 RepID=A0A1S2M1V1_9BACI|nr:hypothetical protein [Anaerobacillus alkalidiazotrophicus]OIJ18719.1 hypothetical protein BKP45_15655 [Anaerobacillus alkalidiazotrophicus]